VSPLGEFHRLYSAYTLFLALFFFVFPWTDLVQIWVKLGIVGMAGGTGFGYNWVWRWAWGLGVGALFPFRVFGDCSSCISYIFSATGKLGFFLLFFLFVCSYFSF